MVREALKNDVLEINRLGKYINDKFEELFHIETEIDNKNAVVLVNEENGVNAFLYATFAIDNYDLLAIVVDKNYQNKKIGSNLMQYFIDNYSKNLPIILEVDTNNEHACRLYKKYQFEVINIRKKYYNGKDAYIMKRG